MNQRIWNPGGPLDLRATLGGIGHGGSDPSLRAGRDAQIWWATWTPEGPGTLHLSRDPSASDPRSAVVALAWGAGASWLLDGVPELLGSRDDRAGFDAAAHPVVHDLDRRFPGLRVPRTRRVFEAALSAVLSQKVTGREASASWQTLIRRYGTLAPGPVPRGLTVPPEPAAWRRLAPHDLMAAGVTPHRVRTVQAVASVAESFERTLCDGRDFTKVDRALQSVPGVGPWTSAEIRQRAHGDADAVSIGDFHVANDVCWALSGQTGRRGDDVEMLRILQPWNGHRYRVQRLLEVGHVSAPRRGPRYSPPDHRRLSGA
jgi:3-methyladenine DNA glycosylase/8-oxoguanine DNA glycosylase